MEEAISQGRKKVEALREFEKIVLARLQKTYEGMEWADPKIEIREGRRFWKLIVTVGGQSSVHSFVDRNTGDVLKPAGWSTPAPKPRGNILDDDRGANALTDHGIRYLR